jgi:hypothetical protein
MLDPDLKVELDLLNQNLTEIKKKTGSGGIWRAFFNGMFSALGYVIGLAIVVVILGWVLQKTGQLPAFEAQIKNFTDLVDSAKKLIPSDQNSSATQQSQQGNTVPTIVTLPDGRQIKVNLPSGY